MPVVVHFIALPPTAFEAPQSLLCSASAALATRPVSRLPLTGAEERTPCGHVLRACLYDGHRFHGAAGALHPRRVKPGKRGTATWSFDAPLLLRCPAELLPRAQVRQEGLWRRC